MNDWKYKIMQFMRGRRGPDELSRMLSIVAMVLFGVSIFIRTGGLLELLAAALLIYAYFRMFSKDIPKRYVENQKYINFRYRMICKWNEHKTYRHFKCKNCGQKVRVPRGKGKICITCPKCRHEFIKKT